MNETEIVKFLAEQIGGVTFLSPNDETGVEYWQFKTPNGKTPYTCIRVADFDPMNKIEHAWMVVERIFQNGSNKKLNKFNKQLMGRHVFTRNAGEAAKAICIAAVKALADDEQCKEWGL